MEKLTYKMEAMLKEKLSLYKSLNIIFKKERNFIIDMDLDSLWQSIERKKKIASQINNLKASFVSLAQKESANIDQDKESLTTSYLINNLVFNKTDKLAFKELNIKIDEQKNDLLELSKENKRFIGEHLNIIDSIFSTVLEYGNKKKYSQSGAVLKESSSNRFINAEV